jgi:hypothetical protein
MRSPLRLIALSAIAVAAVVFAVETVAISDVVKSPEKFDEKVITVVGKVDSFKQKTSKAGNPYYNMKILGKVEEEVLSVYGRGKLESPPKDGDKIQATGIFTKEKKVGNATFRNEVDVTKNPDDKKTKDFGIKVLK